MGTNLIYNGDFRHGTDSWHTTYGDNHLSVSNGVLTVNGGDLYQDIKYLFPVKQGRKYRITWDLKVNTKDSNPWYIALRPYDSAKSFISRVSVYKPWANTNTTLAAAVNNGDTTVKLTSAANWPTAASYQCVGICNKLAWDYNRNTYARDYNSISDNVVTLKYAWSGGSFPAGTKVAPFRYGSTYDYPYIISNANIPTEWTTYTCTFNASDLMYSCQYVQFGTLGYSMNYSIRNLKIETYDDIQTIDWENGKPNLYKESIITSPEFHSIGMPIRYIRDTIAGSTANTNNHWNEIQAFNSVGENVLWGKPFNGHANTIGTDGNIDGHWIGTTGQYDVGTADGTVVMDIGFVEDIHKIKIWHYYPDGRTYYKNKVEVSTDGTNWTTVYYGEKPETIDGNEIILTPYSTQFEKDGHVYTHEIIEL